VFFFFFFAGAFFFAPEFPVHTYNIGNNYLIMRIKRKELSV